MSRFFPSAKRSLDSLLNLITDLVADGLLFFRLLFRSRTALSAEVLFLRKQLAFYEERQAQPRRLNDSARVCLILWSRLCDWKEALLIVKPETLIVCPLSRPVMLSMWLTQPISTPLQRGIRFFSFRISATLSFRLTAFLPFSGNVTGLSCFRQSDSIK